MGAGIDRLWSTVQCRDACLHETAQDEGAVGTRPRHAPHFNPHLQYRRTYSGPRYVIINVQVEGIPSYYEEQVALVVPNVTQLGMKVPVILGTPTIHRLCCQMKESEIQTVPEEWQHALLSYEVSGNVSIHPMTPQLDQDSNVEYPTNTGQDPTNLDEPVLLKDRVIIPAFAS